MRTRLKAPQDEAGQDLVEYALVLCMVALGVTATMGNLTSGIETAFAGVGAQISAYLQVSATNPGNGHGNHGAGSGNGNNGNHFGNGNGNGKGNGG